VLFFTLIFALIIGTIVSNIVFKNSDIGKLQDKPKPSNAINVLNPDISNEPEKKLKFIAVQVGVYKNPQGAEIVKSELNQYGSPFTVEDEKGIRVILGVFTEEKAVNIIRNLSEKNIKFKDNF
jgi:cell division protein FtsN